MSPEKRKDASNSSVFKDASDAGLRVQPTVPETVRFNARTVRGRLVEALRYDHYPRQREIGIDRHAL